MFLSRVEGMTSLTILQRTWTYIGYVRHALFIPVMISNAQFQACRMAVELGLNRYVSCPPSSETEYQMRERRNRERTYLVLFVHDRSLSMQTGRHWMLPEVDVFLFPSHSHFVSLLFRMIL